MSEAKHTPGPWHIHLVPVEHEIWVHAEFERKQSVFHGAVATAFSYTGVTSPAKGIEWSTAIANAHVIAAAPDLLEALEDLVGLAEAAMREANNDCGQYDVDDELSEARAAIAKAACHGDLSR